MNLSAPLLMLRMKHETLVVDAYGDVTRISHYPWRVQSQKWVSQQHFPVSVSVT